MRKGQYSMEFIVFFAILSVVFTSWMVIFSDLSQQGFEERDRRAIEDVAESIRTHLFLVASVEPGFYTDNLVIPDRAGSVVYELDNTQTTLIMRTELYGDYVFPIPLTLGKLRKGRNELWNVRGVVAVGDHAPIFPADALVYYRLDQSPYDHEGTDKVFDSSKPRRNGTVVDVTFDEEGRWNGAYLFDGTDDAHVIVDDLLPDVGDGDMTVSAWFRVDDPNQIDVALVSKSKDFSSALHEFWIKIDAVVQEVRASANNADVLAANYEGDGWHHVAMVLERSTNEVRVYLEGEVVAVGNAQPTEANNDGDPYAITIGAFNGNDVGGTGVVGEFVGMIDEVSIWDRALTEQEIEDLALHYYFD